MKKLLSIVLTICFNFALFNTAFAEAVDIKTGIPFSISDENSKDNICDSLPSLSWSNLLSKNLIFPRCKCLSSQLFAIIAAAGSISWGISQIHSLKYCWDDIKEFYNDLKIFLKNKLSFDYFTYKNPNKVINSLKKSFDEVKGQKTAKTNIERFLYTIIQDKNFVKISKSDYNHADVLMFIGASGVGKSLSAMKIAKAFNVEPLILSAADVDKNSQETLIDQLFALETVEYGPYNAARRSKSLAKYLKSHPKNGIIIINESDKLNPNGELDEILRGAIDNGLVNIKGQLFDFSGILFILTSNETSSCVNNGNFTKLKAEDDGTGSRTIATHDKSFLNRVNVVEFENLNKDEYFEITKTEFSEKVINYWKKYAGIEVIIDDSTFERIAKKAEEKNIGARFLDKIRSNLTREIIEKTRTNSTVSKLYVYYDILSDKFEIKDKLVSDYYKDDIPALSDNFEAKNKEDKKISPVEVDKTSPDKQDDFEDNTHKDIEEKYSHPQLMAAA